MTAREFENRYIALNRTERFEKIPYRCYINFTADFLAAEQGATRASAIAAWKELKNAEVPKDYASWRKLRASRTRTRR